MQCSLCQNDFWWCCGRPFGFRNQDGTQTGHTYYECSRESRYGLDGPEGQLAALAEPDVSEDEAMPQEEAQAEEE